MIQHVTHLGINKRKWDAVIKNAVNPIPYALSWYLDAVSPDWDALILNDYEAVMPLTQNKKARIKYLYQPFFTQQLGVFSKEKFGQDLVIRFLQSIPEEFKFIDIYLNHANALQHHGKAISNRTTYTLPLHKSAEEIQRGFHTNVKRSLSKAAKTGLVISVDKDAGAMMKFFRHHHGKQVPELKPVNYKTMQQMMEAAVQRKAGLCWWAVGAEQNRLSAVFTLQAAGRVIALVSANDEKARNVGAMTFLLNHIITHFAGQDLIFDFEGSNIPGIAKFNASFGAKPETYFHLRRNLLPWFIKWIKN